MKIRVKQNKFCPLFIHWLIKIYISYWVVTTRLTNEYLIWERGGSPASGFPFTVKLSVNYPTQTLTYHPGFWQVKIEI